MTDTIGPMAARIDQQQRAQQLVDAAREEGVELVGPDGLLTGLTKTVLETALEAELDEHLGYDKARGHFPTEQAALRTLGDRELSGHAGRLTPRRSGHRVGMSPMNAGL